MIESPFRPSNGMYGTPSKERTIPPCDGEENNENIGSDRRLSSKRAQPEISTLNKDMTPSQHRPDKRSRHSNIQEQGSDCETEASLTVTARREWLKQFGKQHENTFRKASQSSNPPSAAKWDSATNALRTPPKSISGNSTVSSASAASALVSRMMSDPVKKSLTPSRVRAKLPKTQVQATNDGYASVAKLSEWLANDPTSTKKKRHVRRGRNVISKSRQFEKDMEDVVVVENHISRGAVQGRKKWLQNAFHESDDEALEDEEAPRYAQTEVGAADTASHISVSSKKDWLKNAFKNATDESRNASNDESNRCEIITDDAASSLSVSDKKDWLKVAFKKGKEETPAFSKAKSDVVHCRRGDDAAARAKRRFLSRSKRSPHKGTPSRPKTSGAGEGKGTPSMQPIVKETKSAETAGRDCKEERTGPPSSPVGKAVVEVANQGSVVEPSQVVVEEDRTPVDFSAARRALVQRGKANGHKMQVVNKVYMKKSKYENMEKEIRRRSGPFGLLKPSWEEADPTTGRPSDTYQKKFVPDIAPKKSFEELP